MLDLQFQGVRSVIASFLFESDGEIGLIETGPTSTLPALLQGLDQIGGVNRLTKVVVTHIHLDHAGAVGQLLGRAPGAVCYVHPLGAAHLVDPSKLLRSAERIYGNQMDQLWGEVKPAPEGQIIPVENGQTIRVGGTDLRVIFTPGHASHHVALFDPRDRAVYTGDVAGVRIQGCEHVRPPTPPPDIDLELWRQSVDRILGLDPQELFLTHFGLVSSGIRDHFASLLSRLDAWTELVQLRLEEGQDRTGIVDSLERVSDGELVAEGVSAETMRMYELASPYGMSVDGLIRFLEKRQSSRQSTAVG